MKNLFNNFMTDNIAEKMYPDDILLPIPTAKDFKTESEIIRLVGNKEYHRPKDEGLHEFLINHLALVLGLKWIGEQNALQFDDRHIVMQWSKYDTLIMQDLKSKGFKVGDKIRPSGYTREFLSLASDVYYLKMFDCLPNKILKRLKDKTQFQGVRYEIAVASALIRSGFRIEWITKKGEKQCEFEAIHNLTNESIAIETKSRVRKGTFNVKGDLPNFDEVYLDFLHLYNKAMEQNPKDKPFGVFIDINRPQNREGNKWFWKDALYEKIQKEGDNFWGNIAPSFLAMTNSGWHYEKANRAGKGEGRIVGTLSQKNLYPIEKELTFKAIEIAMKRFGKIPNDSLIEKTFHI